MMSTVSTVSTMSTRLSRHCYQASTNQLLNHYDVYNIYSLYSLYKDFQGLLMLHTITTHPLTPHTTAIMPSCSLSTDQLVARAMARGSYSETTLEASESSISLQNIKEDHLALPPTPELATRIEQITTNLVHLVSIRSPLQSTQTSPASSPLKVWSYNQLP